MPNYAKTPLVNALTNRVQDALAAADANHHGQVSATERTKLPADVRGLADSTASYYLNGGPLPIGAYVNAYRGYAKSAADAADHDHDGTVDSAYLPTNLSATLAAITATNEPTGTSLDALYTKLGKGGWSDDDLMEFLGAAQSQGQLDAYASKLVAAASRPTMPTEDHSGARFYEAMAWYTDMTSSPQPDARLTLSETRKAIDKAAKAYLQVAINQPGDHNGRMQAWKKVQKLRLVEGQIKARVSNGGPAYYAYKPQAMMSINHASAWNAANTVDTPAEFQSDVINASYDKPVLVKFGLTYCMHCLLLEQLGSVPAVDAKYEGQLGVKKLWWNPKDPAMKAISDLAKAEGVTSSPFFIVYKDGEAVRSGYAFPDEKGNGLEKLLQGLVTES